MAKTKDQLEAEKLAKETAKKAENTAEEVIPTFPEKEETPTVTTPSNEDLLKIIAGLQEQIGALTNKLNEASTPVVETVAETTIQSDNSRTEALLEILANRKQDKEVVIVHNREIIGGGSTAIKLTGLTINFHKLGEERVLSWQQFEECVSKYHKFFDKEIILLASDYQELAERYSVPCVKRGSNKNFTRDELVKVHKLDVHALEDYFNSLTKQDKDFLCSYWLGKCYEKAPGFYDRYKIELLNRLSNSHAFDNLLTLMNNEYRNN